MTLVSLPGLYHMMISVLIIEWTQWTHLRRILLDLDSFVIDKIKNEELGSKAATVWLNSCTSIEESVSDEDEYEYEYQKVEYTSLQHSVMAMSKKDAQWEHKYSMLKVSGNHEVCVGTRLQCHCTLHLFFFTGFQASMDTVKCQKGMLEIVAWVLGLHAKSSLQVLCWWCHSYQHWESWATGTAWFSSLCR